MGADRSGRDWRLDILGMPTGLGERMRSEMKWALNKLRESRSYKVTKKDGTVTYKIAERYIWMPPIATGTLGTVEFILYGKSTFVDNVKQVEQIRS
jgi:hypothetical protein